MVKKIILSLVIAFGLLCGLSACHKAEDKNTIRVGVMAGPETTLMQTVQQVMQQQYGIHMDLVTFTSYTMPNEALSSGDLDANYFQHLPYLNDQIKDRGYQLTSIGKVFIYPMGIFSSQLQNLQQIPQGAKVGVPNDPSNEARALLLLQQAGLIKLRPGVDVTATPLDIVSNPKRLQIIAMDGAQLPRSMTDLSIVVLNNTFATSAGLTLDKALLAEDKSSPYVNIVVVRTADVNRPALQDLVQAMHSPEVVAEAHKLFGNGVAKGW